jgi:hypothetical protein
VANPVLSNGTNLLATNNVAQGNGKPGTNAIANATSSSGTNSPARTNSAGTLATGHSGSNAANVVSATPEAKLSPSGTNPLSPSVTKKTNNAVTASSASGTNAAATGTNTFAQQGTNRLQGGSSSGTNGLAKGTNSASPPLPGAPPGAGGPHMAMGGPPGMMGGPNRAAPVPPEIQARVDRITDSEILAPIMHPLPMALLGIAGNSVFMRAPNGQTGLIKEGEELGGVKLLRVGINRVLVQEEGEKKELSIFDGLGGESLVPKEKN